MPKISIVTISFNQRQFLEACVESTRNQSFKDYEHIVVDPGSTDGSREWLASQADPRLRIISKPDNGPAQGLNHGIAEARGTIVAYLNADDALAPDALSTLERLHAIRPGADIIVGNGWTIDAQGAPLKFVRSDKFSPMRYSLQVGTVLQQSTSFKRRAFLKGLAFNETNRLNWDTELLFDAYEMGLSIERTSECIGYFRLQPESITMSGAYEKRLIEQRARLSERGRGRLPKSVLRGGSFVARAIKKVRNSVLNAVERPRFPGSPEAQEK